MKIRKSLILVHFIPFLTCLPIFGQTYSTKVSDIEVINFINSQAKGSYSQKINSWKLEEVYQPDSVLEKLKPRKNSTPSEKRINSFTYGVAPLLNDFLNKTDFEFIKEQIAGLQGKEWQTVKEIMKTKKPEHSKDEYFIYSFPLFSKDKNYAIMKTDFYCGNLCGWSCI
ncbi:hypothetical protein EFA69_14280 [Rufibacter immobilis]|uniref:Uncharacterized protein n=1 Tax=Rufibacter immobilis TaxID=1348778 RepID=A0A3M9MP74_9BACT|nr:hypothetical protein [Rufibacter immobilis]RNI27311.1 hypothetical protein EFA69_14280 [Rufibacter immobilis]